MELTYELLPYVGEDSKFDYYQMVIKDDSDQSTSISLAFLKTGGFDESIIHTSAEEVLAAVKRDWSEHISSKSKAN